MMMLAADFFSTPIQFKESTIEALCVENKVLFRNIVNSFYNENPEEIQMVFSDNYIPFNFKGKGCFISDFYSLSLSSSVLKKIYEKVVDFCNEELQEETVSLRLEIVQFLELIVNNFEYDFKFDTDINLADIFKIQNLKPNLSNENILISLLDFILLISKYTNVKFFVLLNLHTFFTDDEINSFYKEIIYNHIPLLILESSSNFEKSQYENIRIIDNDLCEIVEN